MRNALLSFAAMGLSMSAITSASSEEAASTIGAPVVTVENRSQLHSQQIFGRDATELLDRVDAEVKRVEGQLVKLHFVAIDSSMIDAARAAIDLRYGRSKPVVTCIVGQLAEGQARLGVDAIVALPEQYSSQSRVTDDRWGRVLTPGSRVYVSGQAEKANTPGEATRLTMESLQRTLQWLDSSLDDIVQVKAFVTPISAADEVRAEFAMFVGGRNIPLVMVEWSSTLPIEIELIAAAPSSASSAPAVEYLTPPGMTASPIYCRVAKINAPETIYVGGLVAANLQTAEQEVTKIFGELKRLLAQSNSDLEHLVKATYYVASSDASSQLNALRPQYYASSRPPAASKAMVKSVGQSACNLTIDMIAVRKQK